jgi:hypothetical protein
VRKIDPRAKRCIYCRRGLKAPASKYAPPAEQVVADRERLRKEAEANSLRLRYKQALATIEAQEKQIRVIGALQTGIQTHVIKPATSTRGNEATAVVLASDWHYAGRVGSEVGGLNKFNLDIAHERITKFFKKALYLTNLLAKDIPVPTMVLALLGDFITGHIHEEFMETNQLPPMLELVAVQNEIISGIQFLLDNSDRTLVIPCHSGNHARTTKTTHFASENGHSLEYLMYLHLQAYFAAKGEKRVTFIVPDGPHSYLDIYGTTVRFQHGHMVKYGGGVGGLTIPLNKAIAQWNKGRHADLDVLGHFHQMFDGGNFIVNGSLIGYDSFALSIKASYEKPKQALFLLDRKRGRTFTCPILL